MKSLKVVFFGTPNFAAHCLKEIHESKHHVAGVVTVTDKSCGRGKKINESPVKKYATEQNLNLFQPEKLKNRDFLKTIENLGADVFVVVAFRMMPKILFEIPRLGTFNLHASLLPDYRGAAPINYAIINGETKTGVTTFFINEQIDQGNILLQDELEIGENENAGSLHDRLMELGGKLVVKTLDGLSNNKIQKRPQRNVDQPKSAYKIFKEDTKIDWEKQSKTIFDFIRGLSPSPCAFTCLNIGGEIKSLKIFSGDYTLLKHEKSIGHIDLDKTKFNIYTQDGIYFPQEVQLEGKKRMNIKDFLNGLRSFENIKIV